MKRAWLYVVLGVSIGLNVGTIAAVLYRRHARWRGQREFTTYVDRRVRHEVTDLMKEYRARMDSVRLEFRDARDSLLELGLQDEPDSVEVEQQLDRIANTYREMTRMVYETGRTIQEMHPADKRKWLRRRMRKLMRDPHRRGGRRRRGRGYYGHRGPRSHRDYYGPPVCDESLAELSPPPGQGK